MPIIPDEAECALFILPKAALSAEADAGGATARRILISGNREGMASLAGILLWLHANAYRREFLTLTGLSFVQPDARLALTLRVSAGKSGGDFGHVRRLDQSSEFEWELAEDDLQRLALKLHHLASVPEQEY